VSGEGPASRAGVSGPAAHPAARTDLVLRPMGAEWVLYDPETRDLHLLNTSAALTWSLLDGARSIEGIVEEIRDQMRDAPPADAVRGDVEAAVDLFRSAGLLR